MSNVVTQRELARSSPIGTLRMLMNSADVGCGYLAAAIRHRAPNMAELAQRATNLLVDGHTAYRRFAALVTDEVSIATARNLFNGKLATAVSLLDEMKASDMPDEARGVAAILRDQLAVLAVPAAGSSTPA